MAALSLAPRWPPLQAPSSAETGTDASRVKQLLVHAGWLHLPDGVLPAFRFVFLFPPVKEGPQGAVTAMHAIRIVAGAFKPQQVFPDVVGGQLLY